MQHDPGDPMRSFDLVEQALDLPAADREAFLRRAAGSDAALQARALDLLRDAESEEAKLAAEPASAAPLPLVTSTATAELLNRLHGAARLDPARYQIREMLGAGGMGKVLRVEDKHLRRTLAMKMPHASLPRTEEERQRASAHLGRFLEEAQVTSQLDHPGVVPVHDLGLDQSGQVYFLMRRVLGQNARDVFAKAREGRDGWTISRALEIVLKVCDTMAYAHQKGVLHRDLKPDNIRVGDYGEVYVMDWGLAKVGQQEDRHDVSVHTEPAITSDRDTDAQAHPDSSMVTMDGKVIGTLFYMSPEQATNQPLDHRADIYAIGASLYELLTGKAPYHEPGTWPKDILERVRRGPPTPVEDLVAGTAPELVAIVEKAMSRTPASRYASATELAADLRAFLDQRVVTAYRSGALVELRLWFRRNKSLAASLMAAVGLLVAGVVAVSLLAKWLADTVNDYDQVAVVSEYDLARKKEKTLYPAWPQKIPQMEQWLTQTCDPLLAKAPAIARTIESRGVKASVPAPPESHPQYEEWLLLGRYRDALQYAEEIRTGKKVFVAVEPTREQLATDALALHEAATIRVSQNLTKRRIWGEEPAGLACAQLAVARNSDTRSQPTILLGLAYALLANGRDAEAREQAKAAWNLATTVPVTEDEETEAARTRQIRYCEDALATIGRVKETLQETLAQYEALAAAVHSPRLLLAEGQDKFLLETLGPLPAQLASLDSEQKTSVQRRLRWARQIRNLTLAHPHARVSWAEVRQHLPTSDKYKGHVIELLDDDILGLVPLGRNPNTGYFEFYHLRSAWDGEADPSAIAIPERRADGSIEVTDDTGIVFVLLPGGTVQLGSQQQDPDKPLFDPERGPDELLHYVTLAPFFMAAHELTQGQWERLWDGPEDWRSPSQWKAGASNTIGVTIRLTHPVESIDWATSNTLLTNHALALPSEAQWEYACRAGTTTVWGVRLDSDLADIANLADETAATVFALRCERWTDGHATHAPVGSFRCNDYGLYDMHGNVSEWCRDAVSPYGSERGDAGVRAIEQGDERGHRGGAFTSLAKDARSACRAGIEPTIKQHDIGLRAVRPLHPSH